MKRKLVLNSNSEEEEEQSKVEKNEQEGLLEEQSTKRVLGLKRTQKIKIKNHGDGGKE